jgi:hypothetical protein
MEKNNSSVKEGPPEGLMSELTAHFQTFGPAMGTQGEYFCNSKINVRHPGVQTLIASTEEAEEKGESDKTPEEIAMETVLDFLNRSKEKIFSMEEMEQLLKIKNETQNDLFTEEAIQYYLDNFLNEFYDIGSDTERETQESTYERNKGRLLSRVALFLKKNGPLSVEQKFFLNEQLQNFPTLKLSPAYNFLIGNENFVEQGPVILDPGGIIDMFLQFEALNDSGPIIESESTRRRVECVVS